MTTPELDHWAHGVDEEWSETDDGHRIIYFTDPSEVPARVAARVIYELRLDVDRLNNETIELRRQIGGTS